MERCEDKGFRVCGRDQGFPTHLAQSSRCCVPLATPAAQSSHRFAAARAARFARFLRFALSATGGAQLRNPFRQPPSPRFIRHWRRFGFGALDLREPSSGKQSIINKAEKSGGFPNDYTPTAMRISRLRTRPGLSDRPGPSEASMFIIAVDILNEKKYNPKQGFPRDVSLWQDSQGQSPWGRRTHEHS